MKRATGFALIMTLLASPALAEKHRTEIGPGGDSCGAWNTEKNARLQSDRAHWVFGYISRAAYVHPGDMIAPVDGPAIHSWLDKYCAAHPLERISMAAWTLEQELAARSAPGKR